MAVDIKIQVLGDDKAVTSIENITEAEKKLKNEFESTNKAFKNGRDELGRFVTQNKDGMTRMRDEFGRFVKQNKDGMTQMINSLKNVKAAVVATFLAGVFTKIISEVGKTVASFQKMEAVLTTALGSRSAAQKALNDIKTFAAQTPFQVSNITESFSKLANRIQGIKFDAKQFTAIGDLASATGKDIDVLIEAILDVNNTERWNELGIKVKTSGDKITGTFKGVTKTFERSEQGALAMAEAFGKLPSVAGGMAAVSATLGGKLSNLQDNFEALKLAIGERLAGAMMEAVEGFNELIGSATDYFAIPTSEKLEEERINLNTLATALINTADETGKLNLENNATKALIGELNAQYPTFLGNLEGEALNVANVTAKLKEANKEYLRKIILQQKEEEISEIAKKQIELQKRLIEAEKARAKAQVEGENKTVSFTKGDRVIVKDANKEIEDLETDRIKGLQRLLKELDKEFENAIGSQNDLFKKFGISQTEATENVKKTTTAVTNTTSAKAKEVDKDKEALELSKAKRAILESEIQFQLEKNKIAQSYDNTIIVQSDLLNEEAALRMQLIELKRQEQIESAKLTEERTLANQEATQSIELIELELAQKKSLLEIASLETIDYEQKTADELKKIDDKRFKEFEKYIKKKRELTDENLNKDIEKEKSKQAIINALESAFTNAAKDLTNAYFDNKTARLDQDLANLDAKKQAELTLVGNSEAGKAEAEKRYEAERKRIENEKAKAERKKALWQIAIDTGINAVKLFGQTIPPGILSAVAIAQGGIQAGIIASKPIPKFFHGVDNLQRGNNPSGIDTIPAMLHENERVVPSYINKYLSGVKNAELPQLVALGQSALSNNNMDIEKVVSVIVDKAIKNQTKEITTWNEKGVEKWVVNSQSKTKKLNKLFEL